MDMGAPVVLRVTDDHVVYDVLHLPCLVKTWPRGQQALADVDWPGIRMWPTLCGLEGWVYSYGGPIRDAIRARRKRVCAVCMAAAAPAGKQAA
jgi:hypothetical protein